MASVKFPLNGRWTQTNNNDKEGSIDYSKNINLDRNGYLKLSPRTINIFDDTENTTNIGDTNYNFPVAFGRHAVGDFRLVTTDEPFNIDISPTSKNIAEDSSSNNPNLTFDSHGVWFLNRWHASTSTAVNYNTSGTWTANAITGLTSGVRHYMAVFKNKRSLCVSDGHLVKLYDTSYALQATLTLPTDYEVIGLVYNNYKMAVITRLGNDTEGQNSECFLFVWNGATTGAEVGLGMGAYTSMCIFPYKSSFVFIDSLGRIQYFNGGGFDTLAHFPFYLEEHRWGDLLNHLSYGDNVVVDGDLIIINIGFDLNSVGIKGESFLQNNPSGVWCFDPEVGLYHRQSPSISRTYLHTISQANVNTTTNIFTTSSTIPTTGNPVRLTSGNVGGITLGVVYYVIKLSATTFALAETKELAEAGVKIDITSADTNQYFWIYDLVDFGTTYSTKTGAIALYDTSNLAYKDYIFGGRYLPTSLSSSFIALCSSVPNLENRGYVVFPRLFLNDVLNNTQKAYIKYKPLDTNDKIIVKVKRRDVFNLPLIAPNRAPNDEFVWTGTNEGYTSSDLSKALDLFESNTDLEIEFIAGAGAGQMVKITDLQESGGVYSLSFEENVVGASAGLKSYFIVDNWTEIGRVDFSTQEPDGFFQFSITEISKAISIKIELRGYQTTIEEAEFINTTLKPSL